ncbi:ATP-dependent Clp protease proteolytic subunit [Candidatus Kaiserbacteria bacterium]|nr:ATP-dependent Clp protease proteolytic subunit [Candidatus Kaiserbacteria bacterium]
MPRRPIGKDDEIKIFYDHGLYIPNRTIIVESVQSDMENGESGVDAHMWSRLEKGLCILEKTPPVAEQGNTITVIMNNPGGDEYHMLAMYDRIRASPCHIIIEATGHVMSAGSIILQAADERRMHRHATMMIHHGTYSFSGHTKDFQRRGKETKRLEEVMYDIYLERIRKKHPKFSRRRLEDMMTFDRFLGSQETIELGLADEIIPHTEL